MFPFTVDLSKLSYAAVLDLLSPVLPGGTIALLWLYGHQDVWANMHEERALKIILAALALYIVGFVTSYLSTLEITTAATVILIKTMRPTDPWRNAEWRRLAAKFLGKELTPSVEEPAPETPKPLPFKHPEKFAQVLRENFARALSPVDFQSRWQTWYGILRAYFPVRRDQQQALGMVMYSIFHAIGWAGLVGGYLSHRHQSWLLWITCALIIFSAHVFFTVSISTTYNPDPSGTQLAAEILKALKTREDH